MFTSIANLEQQIEDDYRKLDWAMVVYIVSVAVTLLLIVIEVSSPLYSYLLYTSDVKKNTNSEFVVSIKIPSSEFKKGLIRSGTLINSKNLKLVISEKNANVNIKPSQSNGYLIVEMTGRFSEEIDKVYSSLPQRDLIGALVHTGLIFLDDQKTLESLESLKRKVDGNHLPANN